MVSCPPVSSWCVTIKFTSQLKIQSVSTRADGKTRRCSRVLPKNRGSRRDFRQRRNANARKTWQLQFRLQHETAAELCLSQINLGSWGLLQTCFTPNKLHGDKKLWFFISEGVRDDLFLVFPLCKLTKRAHFLHHPRCFEAVRLLKPARRPSMMSHSHIFPSSSHLLISTEIIGLFFFSQHNNWAVHVGRETPAMLSSSGSRVERLV